MRLFLAILATIMPTAGAAAPPGGDGRAFFLPMLVREAVAQGLPPEIADAVAMVETGYTPGAIGSSGEIGLMQVMPATAQQLGFRGTLAELADPATNIHLGVEYLARAWAAGGQDICRALTKYRAGLGEEVMSPLSAQYCARAMAWLTDGDSRLPDDASASAPPAPDPHVTAMLPPLPEQAGLLAETQGAEPRVQSVMALSPADPYQHSIAARVPGNMPPPRGQARYRHYLPRVQASIDELAEAP